MNISNRDKDMEVLAGQSIELRRQLAAKDAEIAALREALSVISTMYQSPNSIVAVARAALEMSGGVK